VLKVPVLSKSSSYLHQRLCNNCLRFNGSFPGGPALAGTRMTPFWILLELRMMEMLVTTGAIWRAKLQSERHHQ